MTVALLALFVAIGGGYAMAFAGSGTLQKGAKQGFEENGDFEQVRSLTGIGAIDASCSGPGTAITVKFRNTTGKHMVWDAFRSTPGVVPNGFSSMSGSVPPDDYFQTPLVGYSDGSGGDTLFNVTLNPADGTKTPMAHLQIVVWPGEAVSQCGVARVAVLALNTQQ